MLNNLDAHRCRQGSESRLPALHGAVPSGRSELRYKGPAPKPSDCSVLEICRIKAVRMQYFRVQEFVEMEKVKNDEVDQSFEISLFFGAQIATIRSSRLLSVQYPGCNDNWVRFQVNECKANGVEYISFPA